MDEENRNRLVEMISQLNAEIDLTKPGSEERSRAVEDYRKIYALGLDEAKDDTNYQELEFKKELEQKKMKDVWIDRLIRAGIDIGTFTIGTIVYIKLFKDGMIFEKEGTVTSFFVRNNLSKGLKLPFGKK